VDIYGQSEGRYYEATVKPRMDCLLDNIGPVSVLWKNLLGSTGIIKKSCLPRNNYPGLSGSNPKYFSPSDARQMSVPSKSIFLARFRLPGTFTLSAFFPQFFNALLCCRWAK